MAGEYQGGNWKREQAVGSLSANTYWSVQRSGWSFCGNNRCRSLLWCCPGNSCSSQGFVWRSMGRACRLASDHKLSVYLLCNAINNIFASSLPLIWLPYSKPKRPTLQSQMQKANGKPTPWMSTTMRSKSPLARKTSNEFCCSRLVALHIV